MYAELQQKWSYIFKILKRNGRDIIAQKVSVFGVILVRIQSECGKIQTGITPNTDTFHAVLIRATMSFHQLVSKKLLQSVTLNTIWEDIQSLRLDLIAKK